MFLMELMIPVLMTGFGRHFQKHAPRQINAVYGYRTKMSMKNMDTWQYAHQYFGRLWFRYGCFMLPLSVFVMLPMIGKDEDVTGIFGTVIITVQMAGLLLPVVRTEHELHRMFDSQGRRKE